MKRQACHLEKVMVFHDTLYMPPDLKGLSGLSDLKDETKEMSEDEIEIEKPYKIVRRLLKRFLVLIDKSRRARTKNTDPRSNA